MKESRAFYDKFDDKLVRDYINGNPRITNAIRFALNWINATNNFHVLDIGCGLGWSSMEFSKAFNNSSVLGVDLSPVLVRTAKKLFQRSNLEYRKLDVTSEDFPEDKKFGSIVLLDVFEHIPTTSRSNFYSSLKKVLAPGGRIILTCPSVFHQNYLRKNKPSGLQPVDEDVDVKVLLEMADSVNGELRYFAYKTIWEENDYLYAVVEKYDFEGQLTSSQIIDKGHKLESKGQRMNRVSKSIDNIELPTGLINLIRRFLSI
ncbi:MAG: class I SAM-dependent methyltransferase [Bacteroidetes bacterium]|nr:class I SAM-dependent methyltransferase [Bacteroidota bacterium]